MLKSALAVSLAPRSPAADAFRRLREAIRFSSTTGPPQAILVTSPTANEDKTETLANLAVAMAQGGSKVVAVDGDLPLQALSRFLNQEKEGPGLSTALLQPEAELPLYDTEHPNLRVLPGGPVAIDAPELLSSQGIQSIMVALRKQADFVLIDTPPILQRTDATALAPYTDGVLLVLRAGRSKLDEARRAKLLLDRVNAKVLGVVMTNVRDPAGFPTGP